jgi:hypothetical protein
VDLVGERLRAVLDAARDDDELVGADVLIAVPDLQPKPALIGDGKLFLTLSRKRHGCQEANALPGNGAPPDARGRATRA